ncbi:MAG: hypothetical protein U1E53_04530 [Dongiaceae bacterium]
MSEAQAMPTMRTIAEALDLVVKVGIAVVVGFLLLPRAGRNRERRRAAVEPTKA